MPNIEISEKSFEYLKSIAEPLVDTTLSVFDRIIKDHRAITALPVSEKAEPVLAIGVGNMPSVKFASVSNSKVAGNNVTKHGWNYTLVELISASILKGISQNDVRRALEANIIVGEPNEDEVKKGYKYSPNNADFVFQGLDAERACKNIILLSTQFDIPIEIGFRWGPQARSGFANKAAKLTLP